MPVDGRATSSGALGVIAKCSNRTSGSEGESDGAADCLPMQVDEKGSGGLSEARLAKV